MNSRAYGQALEDALQLRHTFYNRDRQALVWHNGTQSIHKRDEVIQVASLPDYTGLLNKCSGRLVCFDAKHLNDEQLIYRHSSKQPHQLIHLWDVYCNSGIAFLLVSYRMLKHWVVWPDKSWANGGPFRICLRDGEYTSWEATECPSDENGLPDWLTVMDAQVQEA